ncbi:Predicted ATPase [Amycolatopsis xylanica]|uniref:Predicted ATPase n=1 Tax=Amycolatopsis xylanica TaxID=589385 RepID=A0A1H2UVY9_9PSEU|nr:BTAD domain-containing putative transcriptional regulator [Amycolatopsis xylanica]SDW59774.1 Predicted ATPase [Amycolatopsis xylanica]
MRFGVLGPLAVWTTEGTPVRVPEAKVRALLAVLLLHEGAPVSADRLAEDLWGERPPGNPANTLQTKVSQLRRTLEAAEPGARELVVHQPPGYLLRAESADVVRFRQLMAEARDQEPRRRVALLADALALWRGPALADFADEPFALQAIQRLEEERLAALEDLAEAKLELGEPVGGELSDLVRRHPLRERLRALHVRALYRAGRQSEALESLAELKRQLAEELGLDPGPEIVALHQAILEQDPALTPSPRSTLPAPLSELVGRAAAVEDLRALLAEARLVTLTGPGGVGKTRLALELARAAEARFTDGARLIELAGLDRHVTDAVADALGIREAPASGSLRDQLTEAVRDKNVLLVFDNCEQVVEEVADLTGRLLAAAPRLRVLATSQEALRLAGEAVWVVPPLDEASAVRLFTDRAGPGFAFDEQTVAAICRRLDGLPLALELAATRVRTLGAAELLARLDDRFRLLAAGNRGTPPRHQTLRAMIDWSWELLGEPERALLRRLAIHPESAGLEAVETVCGGEIDVLARLVDRSLVVVTEGPRYRLLESVGAYSIERLHESGEFDEVLSGHRRFYLELAERARLRGHEQRQWLDRLDVESANFRSALENADAADALRLADALAWYWYLRGKLSEGHRSLTAALAAPGEAPPALKARVSAWQAGFAILLGDGGDLNDQARRALALFDEINDPAGQARAEWFLSAGLLGSGDLAAHEELLDQALSRFRALGDDWGVAAALSTRAAQARPRGDLASAERDGEQSLAAFRRLGDRWGQLKAADVLSSLAEIEGDYERAARLHREGLRSAEELGLRIEMSYELSGLGRIALLTGDYDRAEKLHRRAMHIATEHAHKRGIQFAEVGLGLTARRQGELDRAEAHLRAWLDWCREIDGDLGVALIMAELGFIAELRGLPGAAMSLQLEGFAAARATGDLRAQALALEGMAGAQALAGEHAQAARLLGAAHAARESVGAPLPAAEHGDIDRIAATARENLGENEYGSQFELGRKLAPDQARAELARPSETFEGSAGSVRAVS